MAEHFEAFRAIMRDGVGIPADGAKHRLGPTLTFDPATERHTGEHASAADALLKDPKNSAFALADATRI